ncbi:GTPase [candidate division CSSED10-310 bacterium]|uniref:GTPase n=1 Tax=candidate division CSSED10-310 bacterium TaxID=2855610 RepID=A0ABV6Z6C7_UNCC1
MPANLTPEYKAAEVEYRQAKDPQAKIACLEKMLSAIPKHKGTEKLQADIKTRLKRLRDNLLRKTSKKGFSIKVEKEGTAQVALVGAPNAGKSALVEVTTNARTETADHPFATRSPIPGMLQFENLQFQLVDLPPISEEYLEPWVTDIIRNADTSLWVVDASDPDIASKVQEVSHILEQKKIKLIGAKTPLSKAYDPVRRIRTLVIAAKMDDPQAKHGLAWLRNFFEPEKSVLPLSAFGDTDFSILGRTIFDLNHIIRVFSKTPGKQPDFSRPFVLQRGECLIDFARQVHKDFVAQFRYARIWGVSKFDGQRIQRDQELNDGDIIELHK